MDNNNKTYSLNASIKNAKDLHHELEWNTNLGNVIWESNAEELFNSLNATVSHSQLARLLKDNGVQRTKVGSAINSLRDKGIIN